MKTSIQLAAAYAAKNQYDVADIHEHAAQLESFAKAQGYTITITPPPTVAAWRLQMQSICRVLLDIDMVLNSGGLTEHEVAHNNALRKLWQDKADSHRAAYPGNSAFDNAPRRDIKRERAIMRAGIDNGLTQAKPFALPAPTGGWPDIVIDELLDRVQT